MPPRVPAPLRPGDRVIVVAPSGPVSGLTLADGAPGGAGQTTRDFWQGLAWLRGRYDVRVEQVVLGRDGYLAGSDETRAAAFSRALGDRGARAIVAARGGYGVMRILDRVPAASWEAFAREPSWLVGFSDITALHVASGAAGGGGVVSLHADNVTGLGRALPQGRADWLRALERPRAPWAFEGLRWLTPVPAASIEGPLFGGNLTLLEAMAAAGRLRVPPGAVLCIEDVGERPYRLDRMLTALRLGGYLSGIVALVLGEFHLCGPGPDGVLAEAALLASVRGLPFPVLGGAPFGHGVVNRPLPLGSHVRLEGGCGGALLFAGRSPPRTPPESWALV